MTGNNLIYYLVVNFTDVHLIWIKPFGLFSCLIIECKNFGKSARKSQTQNGYFEIRVYMQLLTVIIL